MEGGVGEGQKVCGGERVYSFAEGKRKRGLSGRKRVKTGEGPPELGQPPCDLISFVGVVP